MGRPSLIALCCALILLSGLKTLPVQAIQRQSEQGADRTQVRGETLMGRAGPVQDGDTFDLVTGSGQTVRIRLRDIDAPEDDQPFGDRSRRMLQDLLGRNPLQVDIQGEDRYGRILGDVRAGSVFVNAEMVRRGGAWAFEDRLSTTEYLLWQHDARRSRLGLWQDDPNLAVPPWSWRRGMRPPPYPPSSTQRQSNATSPAPALLSLPPAASSREAGPACGAKTVCRQMNSCEEALYYLNQCGVHSLDGDSDGLPCERGPC